MKLLTVLVILSVQIEWSTSCCPELFGHSVCYDYDEEEYACIPSIVKCPGTVIGYSSSSTCADFLPEAYIRCVSTSIEGSACRPIEAGCKNSEIQQPNEDTNALERAAFITLRATYATKEECEEIDPYVRCAKDYSIPSASPPDKCISDTEYSWRGCSSGYTRVPSDFLFTSEGECEDYQAARYMRCEMDSSKYCSEYDPETLFECQRSGYERVPSDGVFPSSCSNELSWDLCWDDDDKELFCIDSTSNCGSGDKYLLKITQMTSQGCQGYTPKWSRWVTSTAVKCIPLSEEDDDVDMSGTSYSRVPEDVQFDSSNECYETDYYIQCYNAINNTLYCPKDISGCLGDDDELSDDVFEDWQKCIEISGFRKCRTESTGEITCRPGEISCSPDTELGSVSSEDIDDCLESNAFYYYCYDEENPTERTCAKDYLGCGDFTPLWQAEDIVKAFRSEFECQEYEPVWRLCQDSSSDPKVGTCRPTGAHFETSKAPCESSETRSGDLLTILDNCLAAAIAFETED